MFGFHRQKISYLKNKCMKQKTQTPMHTWHKKIVTNNNNNIIISSSSSSNGALSMNAFLELKYEIFRILRNNCRDGCYHGYHGIHNISV